MLLWKQPHGRDFSCGRKNVLQFEGIFLVLVQIRAEERPRVNIAQRNRDVLQSTLPSRARFWAIVIGFPEIRAVYRDYVILNVRLRQVRSISQRDARRFEEVPAVNRHKSQVRIPLLGKMSPQCISALHGCLCDYLSQSKPHSTKSLLRATPEVVMKIPCTRKTTTS